MPTTESPYWYEIRIQEQIGAQSVSWFEELTLTPLDSGGTMLAGQIADQSALHGLLAIIRDLNLTLISIQRLSKGM